MTQALREAVQFALDALHCPGDSELMERVEQKLRAALAEPVEQPVAWLHPANPSCVTTDPTAYARGIPLYTAPQPQEPTCKKDLQVWVQRNGAFSWEPQDERYWTRMEPATTPQPAEQEPVAWMCADESLVRKGYSRFSRTRSGEWNIPVYTAPQPAKREPLTSPTPLNLTEHEASIYDRGWIEWERTHGIKE